MPGPGLFAEGGLRQLATNGPVKDTLLPQASNQVRRWLDLAQVLLPQKIQRKALQVATQQKLQNHRARRSKKIT
jgi:hypothetical protein